MSRPAIVLLGALLLALVPATAAQARELLQNGDFEQGTSGWSGLGISDGCAPHGGSDALELAADGSASFAQQNVDGPLGDGSYTLTGWLLVDSGSPEISVHFVWLDGNGSELIHTSDTLSGVTSYGSFSLDSARPSGAESLRVRIVVDAGPGVVCIDDVSLDGPPAPPPTAIPTATTPPSPTAAPPTNTPKPGATPKPTSTPKPTATAKPRATTAATQTFTFINGGFEQGLDGWRKYGGELRLVSQPSYSGAAAGELYSATDSTKWAYQTVRIDPSQAYEFTGHVNGGPGMSKAFLRISWYASPDGSGQAISTTDSTTLLETTGGGFVYLTTGAVMPPPGALSAKPRVVLTPLSAAPAAIQFDDLSFAIVAPPTATPPAGATAAGSDSETQSPAASLPAASVGNSGPTSDPGPDSWDLDADPTPLDEVRAVAADSGPPEQEPSLPLTESPAGGGVSDVWLAAGALFVATLGGSYVYGRRRQ